MKGVGKMAVPIGVVAIVLMLVVPLPAALIDMLLAINITASLLILLVAMQIKKPLDFAVFPSLLLVATLPWPVPDAQSVIDLPFESAARIDRRYIIALSVTIGAAMLFALARALRQR